MDYLKSLVYRQCRVSSQQQRQIEELASEVERLRADRQAKVSVRASHVISRVRVEKFVDELLSDPDVNIALVPDSIEKPLYVNAVLIMLHLLQHTLEKSQVVLLDHVIKARFVEDENDGHK
jgi:hypothetical protein